MARSVIAFLALAVALPPVLGYTTCVQEVDPKHHSYASCEVDEYSRHIRYDREVVNLLCFQKQNVSETTDILGYYHCVHNEVERTVNSVRINDTHSLSCTVDNKPFSDDKCISSFVFNTLIIVSVTFVIGLAVAAAIVAAFYAINEINRVRPAAPITDLV